VKSKSNPNSSSVAKQWASAKRKQPREVYSRNSQSSTATPAEPGDLPFGLALIKTGEGFKSLLYNCPANDCSIGYGHLVHRGPMHGEVGCRLREAK
jgi:hypothetical protein